MEAQPLISLKDIAKHYKVGTEVIKALRSITMTINKNEYVAIMGASGSGKSTLMNILGCLDTPTSGAYILNNKEISSLTDNELAEIRNKEIGFVFQSFNLLPRSTTLENVMLPLVYAGIKKEKRLNMAFKVLQDVGLGDRVKHRPNELSGGQKQRVAIARALINNPSIILADEPTGNLDSKISLEIMALLNQIHKAGNTVILVTHEEDIAKFAHRIIKLKDGEIESDTTIKK
ncbi:MAG: Macrolide export ATP-binding/permease protein MacB [Bacteroidetes bacterium ADurb.Bin408]|nr:MAG: Macrolide export ATP-binding/permease protein MacB [Bacteroidetes bacterium ADurb.Bin408]